MQLFEFGGLFLFHLFEVDFFAAELKDVEEPHFGDEFGDVVRVVYDVVAQLAALEVLCHVGFGRVFWLLFLGTGFVLVGLVVHI
jgi:hypothetical protein